VSLDNGPTAGCLVVQTLHDIRNGLVRRDVPAMVPAVAPGLGDVAALEPPLEPPQFDIGEVLNQLNRRPP
jgi:hypothetical protein